MFKKNVLLLLCLFLGIYSCKKDPPPDYPSVQISAPYPLATFNVPASIQVTGHASDSKLLTSVSVYIANSQNIAVEAPLQVQVTSNNMNISCTYVLNDLHLPSGQYYMAITVSNGTNISSAFQQIYIDGVPTKRTAIYAITRNSAGVHAWGIDSAFQVSPAFSYTVSGDYSSSDINSYYQQLYIAGHDSGNVNVYSVPTPAPGWTLTGSPSPSPYFTNVYCNKDVEYVSYYNSNLPNGEIKSYNHSGVIQAVYNTGPGYYPVKTYLWGNLLFTEEKSFSSSSESLLLFYQATTAGYNQAILPGPVIAMYGQDNTHIFVLGNKTAGGAYMLSYNITTNQFSSLISMPGGQLLSAAQIDGGDYLLSFNTGTVYYYSYNPNSITPYLINVMASTVRYDSIDNEVIIASGHTVNEYDYPNPSHVTTVVLSDSVRDVRILYNK